MSNQRISVLNAEQKRLAEYYKLDCLPGKITAASTSSGRNYSEGKVEMRFGFTMEDADDLRCMKIRVIDMLRDARASIDGELAKLSVTYNDS